MAVESSDSGTFGIPICWQAENYKAIEGNI